MGKPYGVRNFSIGQAEAEIVHFHRRRHHVHIAPAVGEHLFGITPETAPLDDAFPHIPAVKSARIVGNFAFQKGDKPVVRPFRDVSRHITRHKRFRKFLRRISEGILRRANLVSPVRRIRIIPAHRRLPAPNGKIHPLRFCRETVGIHLRMEHQPLHIGAVSIGIEGKRMVTVSRIHAFRLAARIREQHRIVIRHVRHGIVKGIRRNRAVNFPAFRARRCPQDRIHFPKGHLVLPHAKIIGERNPHLRLIPHRRKSVVRSHQHRLPRRLHAQHIRSGIQV